MRSFKARVRKIWKAWKIGNTDERGNCEPITRAEVFRMVSLAWEAIEDEAIRQAWQVTRIGHGIQVPDVPCANNPLDQGDVDDHGLAFDDYGDQDEED